MDFWDVSQAINSAKEQVEDGNRAVRSGAALCCHRLRSAEVEEEHLCDLKRELQKWNMRTRTWDKR